MYMYISMARCSYPMKENVRAGRRRLYVRLPVAHGGALASDFSSSRWKGVTASEDGRRDATINRAGLPVDEERPLSFRALLLFASFPLSSPSIFFRSSLQDELPPKSHEQRRRNLLSSREADAVGRRERRL